MRVPPPCCFRVAAAVALVAAVAPAAAAAAASAALPLCASCASWCAGECAFAGPPIVDTVSGRPTPNPRTRQNITVYRMTAATVTDLDNKNTGNPAGDLVFNMDERAIPIVCRHEEKNGPDCTGTNTHSWLLNSNLVYLQWEIEVDGAWGPYLPCNLNTSATSHGEQRRAEKPALLNLLCLFFANDCVIEDRHARVLTQRGRLCD